MGRLGFHLVLVKAVREKTDHHPYILKAKKWVAAYASYSYSPLAHKHLNLPILLCMYR